ncbi:hypothetical protein JD844_017226 [Phrynosoma platyrhinos]|uniref:Uncharacterized protein n=1 Tax=Phrynosoma platyrhinos TaxID=52577 RepID=A0ABQ7SLM2_PHRPL|nr:hypothetical protein JD844_017226 [Phrynosoma platyrhinos]
MEKANATRNKLLSHFTHADISIVQIDVGKLESVLRAAEEIKMRFHRLDYLFLNAGIMVNPRISFWAFLQGIFSRRALRMLTTAEGLMSQEDRVTPDGLQEITQLEPLLCCTERPSQLVWTSSVNAHKSNFSLEDYQHSKGTEAYSSSKYATDLTSVALNNHFNKRLRLFTPTYTLTPYNGAEGQIWLIKQKPETLDPLVKCHSCTSVFGKNYIELRKMDVSEDMAEKLYAKLLDLQKQVLGRCNTLQNKK